jgi:hypothetical protein
MGNYKVSSMPDDVAVPRFGSEIGFDLVDES